MRALVDSVDTQRIVMPEQPALANVNTVADLEAVAPATIALANSFTNVIEFARYRL